MVNWDYNLQNQPPPCPAFQADVMQHVGQLRGNDESRPGGVLFCV